MIRFNNKGDLFMVKGLSILFFLLVSSYAMAQQAPRKQALLVGVSDYQGTQHDLLGIDKDIKKMSALFRAWGFDVKIVQGKDSLYLAHYLHDYANGKNKLVEGDIFAFYFSGHGSSVADQRPFDEIDRKDETLVLSNGTTNIHFLDDDLNYYFSQIQARKLQLFDSCHSGTVNKGGNGKRVQKTIRPEAAHLVDNQLLRRVKKAAYEDRTCHILSYCPHFNEKNGDDALNRTETQKRNLFDFCYCGTVTKQRIRNKDIPASKARISHRKKPLPSINTVKNSDTIVFSASKDDEKSLSTPYGSPFTNEFTIQFSSRFNQQQRSLQSVHNDISHNIITYCKKHKEGQYHPQLSASKGTLKKTSLAEYLRIGQ